MSIEKLYNKVVVPAKKNRTQPKFDLSKNNKISAFSFSNDDYLVEKSFAMTYMFANAANVSDEDSPWSPILSSQTVSLGSKKQEKLTATILTSDKTQGKPLRINGKIAFTTSVASTLTSGQNINVTNIVLKNGETKGYGGSKNTFMWIYDWGYDLIYRDGVLFVEAISNASDWVVDFSITSIEYMENDGSESDVAVAGLSYFVNGNTSFALSDGADIFLSPSSNWQNNITAKVSYTKTKPSKESESIDQEEALVFSKSFGTLSEFRKYCKENVKGDYTVYIGIPSSFFKPNNDEYNLRFDNNTPLFVCAALFNGEITYENFSIQLYSSLGKMYKAKNQTIHFAMDSDESSFVYSGNSLLQSDTKVVGEKQSLADGIGNSVFDKFSRGRRTASLSVFFGEYKDSLGNIVYDGENGGFVKTDDIVTPYTIKSNRNSLSVEEVPLLVDSYRTDENLNKVAVGKEFYVTSTSIKYNGDLKIDLELLERTYDWDETSEYRVYIPPLPTGVESVVVSRKSSVLGAPLGVIAIGGRGESVGFAYESDVLEIQATASKCYNNPTVSLSSYTVMGNVQANIVAGSIKRYTVSFDLNGGVGSNFAPFVVDCGTEVDTTQYSTPSRAEDDNYTYTFSHWEVDGEAASNDFVVYSNIVLKAKYLAKRKPTWHTLKLTNNSWGFNVSPTSATYTNVEGSMYKTNSNIRNVPTRFYTGKDGYMIMTGNANLGNTVRYTMNESGVVLGGSSNKYAASSENRYGKTFGYSLEATNGKITFTVHAQTFTDDNKEYWEDTTQKFYLTYGHITLNKIEQWYADTSENIIV